MPINMIKTLNDDILYNYIIFLLHGNQATILSLGFKSPSVIFLYCLLFLPIKTRFIFLFRSLSVVFLSFPKEIRSGNVHDQNIFEILQFSTLPKMQKLLFWGNGCLCKSLVTQAWRPELSFLTFLNYLAAEAHLCHFSFGLQGKQRSTRLSEQWIYTKKRDVGLMRDCASIKKVEKVRASQR